MDMPESKNFREVWFAVVYGLFYPSIWEALDQYEGVAGGYYEKKKMEVLSSRNGEQLPVWVYLSNDYNYGTPSSSYQEIVVQGARDVNLPESYLPVLEAWADGPPPSFSQ
jgi:hypothetical protein